jgi:hypothetical protein
MKEKNAQFQLSACYDWQPFRADKRVASFFRSAV